MPAAASPRPEAIEGHATAMECAPLKPFGAAAVGALDVLYIS